MKINKKNNINLIKKTFFFLTYLRIYSSMTSFILYVFFIFNMISQNI